jgi:hypothetical protein
MQRKYSRSSLHALPREETPVFNSPDTPNPERIELRVRAEDSDIFGDCLGCDHPVKRVPALSWQSARTEGAFGVNAQERRSMRYAQD